jgi:hypothetical protein
MWAFQPSLFAHLEDGFREFAQKSGMSKTAEFYLVELIDELIRKRTATVKVFSSEDSWFGVTNPDDRPVVQQKLGYLIDEGVYPNSLWKRGG